MTICGRINKLFGTGGGLRLTLYDSFPESFDPTTMPLIVEIDGLDVPLWCEEFEPVGAQGASLIGKEFRMELPTEERDEEEFYLEDLIGFVAEVREAGSKRRLKGEVSDYYDSEQNPLFELTIEGREVLIPAVDEMIAGIDFDREVIKFVLPAGLLD